MQDLLPFQRYATLTNWIKRFLQLGVIALALIWLLINITIIADNPYPTSAPIYLFWLRLIAPRFIVGALLLSCFGVIRPIFLLRLFSLWLLRVDVVPDSGFSFQQQKSEKTWFLHTLPGKGLLLFLYLMCLAIAVFLIVPIYGQWLENMMVKRFPPQLAINQKLYFYVDLAYVSLVIFFEQWDDWYRRHRCAKMKTFVS